MPYGYRGLKIFTSLSLRFQDFQRTYILEFPYGRLEFTIGAARTTAGPGIYEIASISGQVDGKTIDSLIDTDINAPNRITNLLDVNNSLGGFIYVTDFGFRRYYDNVGFRDEAGGTYLLTEYLGVERYLTINTPIAYHFFVQAELKGSISTPTYIEGTVGIDNITGTPNADVIDGLAGDDSITALAGNDTIYGGYGNDTITGGIGNDSIDGGTGNDTVRFYEGFSAYNITYNASNLTFTTQLIAVGIYNDGTDQITNVETFRFNDTSNKGVNAITLNVITNGDTSKTVNGTSGQDLIYSGAGNDIINGGAGNDALTGGLGNDTYIVDSITDTITEKLNEGTDLIQSSVTFSLALIANVENLTLTGTANINATGNALANTLTGNNGNNTLDGLAGTDTLVGGLGNDIYVVDLLLTGLLQDTVTETSTLVDGNDTIQLRGSYTLASATTVAAAMTLGANIENLDAHDVIGGTGLLNIVGNALTNTISGSAANDVITGAGGTDKMYGANGNDLFIIALAADHTSTEIIDGGTGTADEIRFTAIAASTLTLSSFTVVENITIGTGTAATAVSTATTALNIYAAAVTSEYGLTITGNAGVNILTGTGSADILNGGLGNDSLIGGGGADKLTGGKGQDSLTGGLGNDTFTFAAGDDGITLATLDKILDYTKGAVGTGDLIDYSATLTKGGNANAATASQASIIQTTGIATFASGSGTTLADALNDIAARFTAATDTAGEFAFFKVNGTGDYYLFISDGTAGAGVNDDVIQLVGITSIGSIALIDGNLMING